MKWFRNGNNYVFILLVALSRRNFENKNINYKCKQDENIRRSRRRCQSADTHFHSVYPGSSLLKCENAL